MTLTYRWLAPPHITANWVHLNATPQDGILGAGPKSGTTKVECRGRTDSAFRRGTTRQASYQLATHNSIFATTGWPRCREGAPVCWSIIGVSAPPDWFWEYVYLPSARSNACCATCGKLCSVILNYIQWQFFIYSREVFRLFLGSCLVVDVGRISNILQVI